MAKRHSIQTSHPFVDRTTVGTHEACADVLAYVRDSLATRGDMEFDDASMSGLCHIIMAVEGALRAAAERASATTQTPEVTPSGLAH